MEENRHRVDQTLRSALAGCSKMPEHRRLGRRDASEAPGAGRATGLIANHEDQRFDHSALLHLGRFAASFRLFRSFPRRAYRHGMEF